MQVFKMSFSLNFSIVRVVSILIEKMQFLIYYQNVASFHLENMFTFYYRYKVVSLFHTLENDNGLQLFMLSFHTDVKWSKTGKA